MPDELDRIAQWFAGGVHLLAQAEPAGEFDEFRRWASHEPADLQRRAKGFLAGYQWPNELKAADTAYAVLQYGLACGFEWPAAAVALGKLDRKSRLEQLLAGSYASLPATDDAMARACTDACARYNELEDSHLVRHFQQRIEVRYRALCGQADPQVFTKLNHGFWEYFLHAYSAFDDGYYRRHDIRDLRSAQRPDGARSSGFYPAMHALMAHSLSTAAGRGGRLRFAVGLTAGESRVAMVLRRPLQPVTRGAMMGMLSFIDSLGKLDPIVFEDGASPRRMLMDGQLARFMDEHVHAASACLVVGPDHLRRIAIPGFHGALQFIATPRAYIHEEWRSVLPVLLGAIADLQARRGRVTVLAQGANFATMLAFAVDLALPPPARGDVSFFDLGRVLDIADPEICGRWPSLAKIVTSLGPETAKLLNVDGVATGSLLDVKAPP